MFDDAAGPIEHCSWGKFIIDGTGHGEEDGLIAGHGKDIRLIGREVSEWRERRGHELTPAMIDGVLNRGLEIVIIGNGVDQKLRCPEAVIGLIEADGATVLVRPTPEACLEYNRFFHEGKRVALLAHGTC